MKVRKLSRGRPKLDAGVKLVKTGVALPPPMMAQLDRVAKFARVSRSTVMAYLLEAPLHDLSESVEETLYLTRNDPDGDAHIDFLAKEFLCHVSPQFNSGFIGELALSRVPDGEVIND